MQFRNPAPWIPRVTAYALGLLRLPAGWDSYRARQIAPGAVILALGVLSRIARRETIEPSFVPTVRGTIQIEWHSHGLDLEVEPLSHERVHFYCHRPSDDQEWEGECSVLSPDLSRLIDQLTVHP